LPVATSIFSASAEIVNHAKGVEQFANDMARAEVFGGSRRVEQL
jgi:hypothetical protein